MILVYGDTFPHNGKGKLAHFLDHFLFVMGVLEQNLAGSVERVAVESSI
jgi:hypothetical protein